MVGEYAIIMRNSLIEVFTEDYMLTAQAKGVSKIDLLMKHAIPNAMLPLVTLIAINLGFVVAGAIQVETVFSWPGLGRLMYTSLLARDYPLLQGLFLFITICVSWPISVLILFILILIRELNCVQGAKYCQL